MQDSCFYKRKSHVSIRIIASGIHACIKPTLVLIRYIPIYRPLQFIQLWNNNVNKFLIKIRSAIRLNYFQVRSRFLDDYSNSFTRINVFLDWLVAHMLIIQGQFDKIEFSVFVLYRGQYPKWISPPIGRPLRKM